MERGWDRGWMQDVRSAVWDVAGELCSRQESARGGGACQARDDQEECECLKKSPRKCENGGMSPPKLRGLTKVQVTKRVPRQRHPAMYFNVAVWITTLSMKRP